MAWLCAVSIGGIWSTGFHHEFLSDELHIVPEKMVVLGVALSTWVFVTPESQALVNSHMRKLAVGQLRFAQRQPKAFLDYPISKVLKLNLYQ